MPKAPSHIPTVGTTELLALKFCEACQRKTLRLQYENGDLGPCMGCHPDYATKKQQQLHKRLERERQNPSLF
jgi:hypothetical protein